MVHSAGGAWKAIERARSVDCESTQIFVKSNMQWFGKPLKPADAERFRGELAKGDVGTVFGHAGYLINLAGPDGDNLDKSMESLSQEIEFANTLGVPFLVLHPGAHLGQARGDRCQTYCQGAQPDFSGHEKIAGSDRAGKHRWSGHLPRSPDPALG